MSKDTKKILDCALYSHHWCCFGVFTVNFWTYSTSCSSVCIADFEQENCGGEKYLWHKDLIKSFISSSKFPQIFALHLSIKIYFPDFCKFYLFSNYGESKKEKKQVKLNLEEKWKRHITSAILSRQYLYK